MIVSKEHSSIRLLALLVVGFTCLPQACADEVTLKNGDRFSGRIVSEDERTLILEHEAAGRLTLQRAFIARITRSKIPSPPQGPEKPIQVAERKEWEWEREFAFGVALSRGNTDEGELSGRLLVNAKSDHDEWTGKFEGYLAESQGSTNAQRYAGSGRYAFSFGRGLAWYNFYKLELNHDRFANIDWRVIPSAGVGVWFSDEAPLVAMVELGAGWERTQFKDATASTSEPVLIPRGWMELTFPNGAQLSQELTLWSELGGEIGAFRLKAETLFTNPVTERWAIKLRFVDEFDSDPAGSSKKNDLRLTTELAWSF